MARNVNLNNALLQNENAYNKSHVNQPELIAQPDENDDVIVDADNFLSEHEIVDSMEISQHYLRSTSGETLLSELEEDPEPETIPELRLMLDNIEEIDEEDAEVDPQRRFKLVAAFTIARRISNGDNVPPQDRQFLFEFDRTMYQDAVRTSRRNPNDNPLDFDSVLDKMLSSIQAQEETEYDENYDENYDEKYNEYGYE